MIFSLWTAAVAVFLSVFALADNAWPSEVDTIAFHKRTIAVALYVLTIVAGSVTMWEAWKVTGIGGGGAYQS